MSNPQQTSPAPSLQIKADDEIAKGRFVNLAQAASSHDAFVLDFAFVQHQLGWLISRLILSPTHAKRFHRALGSAITQHEERFGEIDLGPHYQ